MPKMSITVKGTPVEARTDKDKFFWFYMTIGRDKERRTLYRYDMFSSSVQGKIKQNIEQNPQEVVKCPPKKISP